MELTMGDSVGKIDGSVTTCCLDVEGLYAGVRLTGSSEVFLANENPLDNKKCSEVEVEAESEMGWNQKR